VGGVSAEKNTFTGNYREMYIFIWYGVARIKNVTNISRKKQTRKFL